MQQDAPSPSLAGDAAGKFAVVSKKRIGGDERVAQAGSLTRLLRRPEAGAASGLIVTIIVFALLPGAASLYSLQGSMTFLTLAAELGIISTAMALLIIAGEFDPDALAALDDEEQELLREIVAERDRGDEDGRH